MKELVLFGIANCDTVKRARAWLTTAGVPYRFHDFKKQGVPVDSLARWNRSVGWESLVNRRGTTWRKLDDAVRTAVVDGPSAAKLMTSESSVIKRPVVEWPSGDVSVGFTVEDFERRIAASR